MSDLRPSEAQARAVIHRIERATLRALGHRRPARLLVAISGGTDSSAALIALTERAAERGWAIGAAYLDHGLAPAPERAAFLDAVQRITCRLDVPLRTDTIDPRERPRGAGVEAAARSARYAFLARAGRETDAEAVVTGHTRGDQAETVLMHLIRGSGIGGLAGMRPRAPMPVAEPQHAPPLVRPLLDVARAETEALCHSRGIEPVLDPANLEPGYTRNRIRHTVLPLLREMNPRVDGALARLAAQAAVDSDTLAALAVAARATVGDPTATVRGRGAEPPSVAAAGAGDPTAGAPAAGPRGGRAVALRRADRGAGAAGDARRARRGPGRRRAGDGAGRRAVDRPGARAA